MGLCGLDGSLLKADQLDTQLGFVGEIREVNAEILQNASANGYVPIVSTVAAGYHGEVFNISADVAAAARAIAELKVQPRPVSLAYEASLVMAIVLGAAKEGASLYAVTDPAGITHRVWEVKREDAVGAIRAMLDQAPEPALADDPAYAAALVEASQLLADEARSAGTYTGKEPFNFTVAVLFPAAQVSGGAPQVPTGLLAHQVARF